MSNEDRALAEQFLEPADHLAVPLVEQVDIGDDDIGGDRKRFGCADAVGLGHDDKIGLPIDQRAQSFTKHDTMVDDQHAHCSGRGRLGRVMALRAFRPDRAHISHVRTGRVRSVGRTSGEERLRAGCSGHQRTLAGAPFDAGLRVGSPWRDLTVVVNFDEHPHETWIEPGHRPAPGAHRWPRCGGENPFPIGRATRLWES